MFGYGSWGLLIPQALMGVASVGAGLRPGAAPVRSRRGHGGRAGAGADADRGGRSRATTTPTRCWCCARRPRCGAASAALEDGRTRWLVLGGVAVGLGFETKMAVALMVVPGIVAAYLWIAPRGLRAAMRPGGRVHRRAPWRSAAAWPLLLALTPSAGRPWVSGTATTASGR